MSPGTPSTRYEAGWGAGMPQLPSTCSGTEPVEGELTEVRRGRSQSPGCPPNRTNATRPPALTPHRIV